MNPNIKFEVFIHKVDGISDDHKMGMGNIGVLFICEQFFKQNASFIQDYFSSYLIQDSLQ